MGQKRKRSKKRNRSCEVIIYDQTGVLMQEYLLSSNDSSNIIYDGIDLSYIYHIPFLIDLKKYVKKYDDVKKIDDRINELMIENYNYKCNLEGYKFIETVSVINNSVKLSISKRQDMTVGVEKELFMKEQNPMFQIYPPYSLEKYQAKNKMLRLLY